MQIDKVYEPQRFEPHWAQSWIDSGIFRANPSHAGRVFSLVIPPPNVTGSLHIGHMLEHTEIDVTVRWHRMLGDNTLWLPGTDHAGIATQMVVERKLAEEGILRRDLGREEFEKRVWQWKAAIRRQHQAPDDPHGRELRLEPRALHPRSRPFARGARSFRAAVRKRPHLSRRVHGELVPALPDRALRSGSGSRARSTDICGTSATRSMAARTGFVTVATTRPETMLGDTAVAINPKDARYLDLHGKTVQLPLMDREIPIILDELADPEFGTGVVKVTPAHDPNDFEAGRRHNLPKIKVIDENARMTAAAGPYAGLDRFERAGCVVADLEKIGALEKIADYTLNLGSLRAMQNARRAAGFHAVVRQNEAAGRESHRGGRKRADRIHSGELDQDYYEWMCNIRDWCISRQLWWGHRIPAWHCRECNETPWRARRPTTCPQCGGQRIGAGSRRAGHLVQLRAVAVFHARLAGEHRRSSAHTTRLPCSSPDSTSCFSGSPA